MAAPDQRFMIVEVVYISAATCEFSDEELAELLRLARRRNAEAGITGMLLFHEGSFLQVLEGEAESVDALFDKIAEDPRHANCRVLLRREVEERTFGDWSMGYCRTHKASDLPEGFNRFLQRGFDLQRDVEESVVMRTLRSFRGGNWRARLDSAA